MKHALVLGGTGAIGCMVTRALAQRAIDTTFTWHTNEERAQALAAAHSQTAVRVDLTRPEEIRALFANRSPDILIHCAAVNPLPPNTVDDFDRAVALSGRATFVAIEEFAKKLVAEARPGHVVLVGALERAQSLPLSPAFAAAQGMLGPLAMSFAKALGPHGILVNLVAGGLIGDGVSRDIDPASIEHYKKLSALHRLGSAEEIVAPILFLALDNTYMTGKTLAANGGI